MKTIKLDEIQQNFLDYLQRVKAGETVLILQNDEPVAEFKPVAHETGLRPYTLCAGEFRVPDDFDAPLPEEIVEQFEGR
jgi:antitoxin (DNA-binding transcriptional repressor) of toxin-antitoxin stability system